jgi:hypothetical protein
MRKKKESHGVPTFSKKHTNTNTKQKSKSQHSIMHKHDSRLDEFKNKPERIRQIDAKIRSLEALIKRQTEETLRKQLNKENTTHLLDSIRNNKVNLDKLKKDRQYIESGQDQIDYLLESSWIMMEYLDIEQKESKLLESNHLSEEHNLELNELYKRKTLLVDDYLCKFDPTYTNQKRHLNLDSISCTECRVPFTVEKSFLVCPNCGICQQTVEQATELSYKELQDFDYRPQFTYDKMTHLEDWLRRFQAKENRSIPQEILDKVLLEANKERVQDLNTLTEDKIKRYLKKLNLNDYYDNVIGIINRINGRPPFTLTSEVEDKIKIMFQQIQDPYDKFKPAGRKNFLSYSYTLHKFFQILGLHEFAKYFPLLKSTDKLRQQDDIFKKIVGFMSEKDPVTKWVFYPSI